MGNGLDDAHVRGEIFASEGREVGVPETILRSLRVLLETDPREDAGAGWKLLHAHDAAVYALDQIETTGRAFLQAYIDASVSDEEGLLAAIDQREWRAMWQRVDEAAQKFGRVIGGSPGSVPGVGT